MTARDEILVAARHLAGQSTDGTFSPAEVISELLRRGSTYHASTIRTHVVSRMCGNTPDHHAVVYSDLERAADGRYRLLRHCSPKIFPATVRSRLKMAATLAATPPENYGQ